jgi:DhnA family fructose-bisphosphate aldolase class Ia
MKLKVLILIFVLGSSSCKDKMIAIPEDPQIPLTGILSTLKKDHPRLMLSLSQVEEIKLKIKSDVAIALRLDVTNVYEARDIDHAWDRADISTLDLASDTNVAAVVLNLLNVDENSRLQEQCIQNIQVVAAKCHKLKIPLMVEPLVMTAKPGAGSTSVGDVNKITGLVRQAVELGADIIKVDATTPMTDFHQVVQFASGMPVLVRGGGQVTPRELLERTRIAIDSGAAGVVYGRNVVQHPNPAKFIKSIAAIVHNDASVEQAIKILEN